MAQQSVSAQQMAELKSLAELCRGKISFGGPRITFTSKCFSGRYPKTLEGYQAARATLENMLPKQKEVPSGTNKES